MNNSTKEWTEDMNRLFFFQRRPTDAQQTHEKMFNIIIREIEVKTTMRYHLTPVLMVKIKKMQETSVGEYLERKEASCTVGEIAN